MDREFLSDLFATFGPVTIRRMFSGFGISADGINFAMVIQGAIYLRADAETIPRFEAEGRQPFQYSTRAKTVTVASYWQLPERLLDDPDEFAGWARDALRAAERAAMAKAGKRRAAQPARAAAPKRSAAKIPKTNAEKPDGTKKLAPSPKKTTSAEKPHPGAVRKRTPAKAAKQIRGRANR